MYAPLVVPWSKWCTKKELRPEDVPNSAACFDTRTVGFSPPCGSIRLHWPMRRVMIVTAGKGESVTGKEYYACHLARQGYRFWFYEADLDEPPHVHIGKEGQEAKYWLDPVKMARAGKFRPVDLREIEHIINDNLDFLLRTWEKEQSKRANG